MDFRQLRYFVAVAEELSFSRAAERLNISQPPLSIQIKAMEEELDTVLFDRNRHSVMLTCAGKLLLTHARMALHELDRAGDLVRRAGKGEAGIIRMGFIGSIPMLELFSYLLGGFRQQFPHVRIELHHMSTNRQISALQDGQLDIGFVRPSPQLQHGSTLRFRTVWTDRLKVFFPAGHPRANARSRLKLRELADEAFVGIAAGAGCGVHDMTIAACSAAGFIPRVVQEAHDLRTVLWLVAGGTGIAILPECYDQAGVASVVSLPLLTPHFESHISVLTRTDNKDPLLVRFVEHAMQFASVPESSRLPEPAEA
jgi:DNA-binding transcriptional LysR family regulator